MKKVTTMTNNIQLTQPDLDHTLDATDAAARNSISKIYTALGHMLNDINLALVKDPDLRNQLEQHLVVIDEESRTLQVSVTTLTAEMTALAAFANEIRGQRDDALWEIKDLSERLQEVEANAESTLYARTLDSIQETFNCTRKSADKLLFAIWDYKADVSSNTAELLDRIANVIGEWEDGL